MYSGELSETVRSSVKRGIGHNDKVGLFFSGGVDSAALAVVARKFANVTLYLAGTPDSHDMEWGLKVGYTLDLPVTTIAISKEKVIASFEDLVDTHGIDNPRWMTTFIAFNLIIPHVKESLIISGQGADELFAGYRKYAGCPNDEAERMMLADLKELQELEVPLYRKIAGSLGKELVFPFLEPEVVSIGNITPFEEKLDNERNKIVLRNAARELGVPVSISEHPKKAMQYGSGVTKIMKAYLREVDMSLSELISDLRENTGKEI
jgi:asparagine synthase (glutamine-hydrolysing)